MSYQARVFALLFLFFAFTLGASGTMIYLSRDMEKDRLDVGPGHGKFPPQAERQPRGAH